MWVEGVGVRVSSHFMSGLEQVVGCGFGRCWVMSSTQGLGKASFRDMVEVGVH